MKGHSSTLQRMRARLRLQSVPPADPGGPRPLAALTTRDGDDPTLALLDAWAVAVDVLGFYHQRIEDEGFLASARERRSLLELGRLLGYEPPPGLAASTFLAFTVDDAPGAAERAPVERGTAVMSTPSPGQMPQVFETDEAITAHASLNVIRAAATLHLTRESEGAVFELSSVVVEPGDLLILGIPQIPEAQTWYMTRVLAAERDLGGGLTRPRVRVRWTKPEAIETELPAPERARVIAFRDRVPLFGYNAPPAPDTVSDTLEWPPFAFALGRSLDLAQPVTGLAPRGLLVLHDPEADPDSGARLLLSHDDAHLTARNDFGLRARVTRLELSSDSHNTSFGRRSTTAFVRSADLELAAAHDPRRAIQGREITLDAALELVPGRPLVISGRLHGSDEDAPLIHEVAFVEALRGHELTLQDELEHRYDSASLTINANVAPASHGETVVQILGSGDSRVPHQRFTLLRAPLTHVSAATTTGLSSALELRVGGVRWRQVDALAAIDGPERVYAVRVAQDGRATLVFGDGVHGARLPTGRDNVVATYRHGLGLVGEVAALSLNMFKAKPAGIRTVFNPVAADGAADPETLEQTRTNLPAAVSSIDRLVSLRDYSDFAQAFAGVGKASAVALWDGTQQVVHVSVAGSDGAPINEDTAILDSLHSAFERARDPMQAVMVDSCEGRRLVVGARLEIDTPRYRAADVLAAARGAIVERWSFARVSFGQRLAQSEVIAVLQGVAGVLAVNIHALRLRSELESEPEPKPKPEPMLTTRLARSSGGQPQPAELLIASADDIELEEWKS